MPIVHFCPIFHDSLSVSLSLLLLTFYLITHAALYVLYYLKTQALDLFQEGLDIAHENVLRCLELMWMRFMDDASHYNHITGTSTHLWCTVLFFLSFFYGVVWLDLFWCVCWRVAVSFFKRVPALSFLMSLDFSRLYLSSFSSSFHLLISGWCGLQQ